MTTVLAVYNSEGCVGTCDARCHEAKHSHCTCICGGKNHGAGFAGAQANVEQMIGLTPEDLTAFAEAHHRDQKQLTVVNRLRVPNSRHARKQAHDKLIQPDLFDEGVA